MPRQWHIFYEDPDIVMPSEVHTFHDPVALRAAIKLLQRERQQFVTVECSLGEQCPHVSGQRAEENVNASSNAPD